MMPVFSDHGSLAQKRETGLAIARIWWTCGAGYGSRAMLHPIERLMAMGFSENNNNTRKWQIVQTGHSRSEARHQGGARLLSIGFFTPPRVIPLPKTILAHLLSNEDMV